MNIYLIIAALFLVASIIVAAKNKILSWGLALFLPFYALAWPLATVVNYLMWRQHATCAWCGEVTAKDRDTIQAHIMECKKHPMRPELEELEQLRYGSEMRKERER